MNKHWSNLLIPAEHWSRAYNRGCSPEAIDAFAGEQETRYIPLFSSGLKNGRSILRDGRTRPLNGGDS